MSSTKTRLGAALLVSVVVLGTTAAFVGWRARQAERKHPAKGQFIEINGIRLHYLERGKGQPVVLLHGNGAMAEDFEISGVLGLAAERYRVIVFDRPGFGYSGRPRTTVWTPAAQAHLLYKAMQQLRIDRPVVVGHSWGTLVALALALDHPQDVRSLVLLSGYYFPTVRADVLLLSPPAIPVVGDVMRYTISPLVGWLMRKAIIRKVFAPSPVPARFAAAFPVGLSLRPSQIRASAADTALMVPAAAVLSRRYGELAMPIVILAGTGDKIADFRHQSKRLHDAVPQSDLLPIDGAGHMIHYLAPRQVIRAIDIAARPPGDVRDPPSRDAVRKVDSADEAHTFSKIA